YFFITHDLGVVKHFCDRILVMYLGNTCELCESKELFAHPLHPYTKSLLASVPRPTVNRVKNEEEILQGEVPSSTNPPKGCPFHTRCSSCMDVCRIVKPESKEVRPQHFVACHLFDQKGALNHEV
ncbi:MAG: ABC transporter ATP-binding protein, partial [Erysipelotrichales bacterium]